MAMAEVTTSPAIPAVGEAAAPAIDPTSSTIPSKRPRAPLRDIYALPTPIRTFPLPSFYPSNPISLFHVVYAWLSHALSPPPPEPSVIHTGVWSPGTRSVHVADERSIRALWEQGFYGKGNLSRSEPNWLRREQIRRGLVEGDVSEEITVGRRNERITAKWERARAEQEAIERTRLAESRAGHNGTADALPNRVSAVPVGPLELLALPNSYRDIASSTTVDGGGGTDISAGRLLSDDDAAPAPDGRAVGFENSTTVDGSQGDAAAARHTTDSQEGLDNGTAHPHTNGESFTRDDSRDSLMDGNAPHASGPPPPDWDGTVAKDGDPPLKRQKSVRFSPQVQSTTFLHSDPPSPNHSTPPSVRGFEPSAVVGVLSQNSRAAALGSAESGETWLPPPVRDIANKEHLQLSPEEAFFLVFALGALRVVDPATGAPIPAEKLLALFRAHSYFPPRVSLPELQPDDSFLVHYAVYHHFRSLGWVPRHGIKFGVDWLLYLRGPVFDHAEFGLVVLPSYSDPWWKDHGRKAPRRSWAWLHGVNRVLSHAVKSLVLVYVDVPSPAAFAEAMELAGSGGGIAAALKRYKIREVMIRRWSSNRNRS